MVICLLVVYFLGIFSCIFLGKRERLVDFVFRKLVYGIVWELSKVFFFFGMRVAFGVEGEICLLF